MPSLLKMISLDAADRLPGLGALIRPQHPQAVATRPPGVLWINDSRTPDSDSRSSIVEWETQRNSPSDSKVEVQTGTASSPSEGEWYEKESYSIGAFDFWTPAGLCPALAVRRMRFENIFPYSKFSPRDLLAVKMRSRKVVIGPEFGGLDWRYWSRNPDVDPSFWPVGIMVLNSVNEEQFSPLSALGNRVRPIWAPLRRTCTF